MAISLNAMAEDIYLDVQSFRDGFSTSDFFGSSDFSVETGRQDKLLKKHFDVEQLGF